MQTGTKKYNKYCLIRDLAALFILGILLGHLIRIPIIVWRILFVIEIVVAIVANVNYLNKIEGYILALASYCAISFMITFSPDQITIIGAILFTVPTVILFKFLDSKEVITQKWINVWCVIFVIAAVIFYRYKESVFFEEFFEQAEYGFTNNASTVFTGLLVLLLLSDKKVIVWGCFVVCWYFLLLSSKRGNIAEALIPSIVLFFQMQKDGKRKIWNFLFVTALFAAAIYFGMQFFEKNTYLTNKIDVSGANGRDVIWANLINEWSMSSSPFKVIFGYGIKGTLALGGIRAHNDFLEILVDFGLIGIVLQMGVFVSLFKLLKFKISYRLIMIAAISVYFLKSMISMGFTDPLNVFTFMTMGIVISRYEKQFKLKN